MVLLQSLKSLVAPEGALLALLFALACVAHNAVVRTLLVVVVLVVILFRLFRRNKDQAGDVHLHADESEVHHLPFGLAQTVPLSVNYHFTRVCNYSCGFCFHTQKSKDNLSLESSLQGLRMLKEHGLEKINFSGGEPFLYPDLLGKMVQYCKKELGVNVSIVSNGSKIQPSWFEKYGQYVDILAVSCDSFDPATNKTIGRRDGSKAEAEDQAVIMRRVSKLCHEHNVVFKLNTVVNTYNWEEDMGPVLAEIKPARWKVFQCLLIDGENAGEEALRHAESFCISSEQFESFISRHKKHNPVSESNELMKDSYLILDEKMRFLNCQDGKKTPSGSILEIGVLEALKQSGFDSNAFMKRGGVYEYSKDKYTLVAPPPPPLSSSTLPVDIEDLLSSSCTSNKNVGALCS